ncbi:DNA-binding protein [Aquitalea sp. FJL05]|nr:DNA-binding protein [Aquitalea sp. FJL05]
MTLDNLMATGQLLRQPADKAAIQKLLAAAARNLADAALPGLSADNRFDAAYKTIMQCAMVGLLARGYRTSTSKPGHHQTAIQCLPKTMDLPPKAVIVLDALRKQRNVNDYQGDPIADSALDACLQQAAALLAHTRAWLAENHPEWSE